MEARPPPPTPGFPAKEGPTAAATRIRLASLATNETEATPTNVFITLRDALPALVVERARRLSGIADIPLAAGEGSDSGTVEPVSCASRAAVTGFSSSSQKTTSPAG